MLNFIASNQRGDAYVTNDWHNAWQLEIYLTWENSMMPVAWTKKYTSEDGNSGKVFNSTMGASVR